MAYWILMFRPETYELVKKFETIGVLHMHRRRFAQLKRGDRFVTYVSRERLLDGHGELTSEPFVDDKPVFGPGDPYPQRCRVRFLQTGARQDAKELLWSLSHFTQMTMKTTPTNYLR
ncbi:MAG: hypothetical protein HY319_15865, partial [Armatimonadetes bacterium]|nr:hypothetical protein [Armatimonadota bacterium]